MLGYFNHQLRAFFCDNIDCFINFRKTSCFKADIHNSTDDLRKFIGVVQQETFLFSGTVKENISYGNPTATDEDIVAAAKLAGVHKFVEGQTDGYDTYIGEHGVKLSGGQRHRVALGRAIVRNPKVFLMDEPLSNFDARMRDQVRDEIRRICKENKLTAIYVTHDCKEALSVADRIGVMRGGVLEQVGSPREIYRQPRNAFVAEFIGNAFIFEVECVAYEEGENILRALSPYGEIMIAPADGFDKSKLAAGRKLSAMFRPEDVRFGQAEMFLAEQTGHKENKFSGEIVNNTFYGENTVREIACGEFKLAFSELGNVERAAGSSVEFFIRPENIVILESEQK